MNCPKCGEELRRSKKDPHYGLCDNCRKKFKWVDDYDEDDYEEDDEYIERKPAKRKTQNPSSVKPHSKRKKKKSSGMVIGIVIALAVLLVAVAIIFFFVKGRDKEEEKEPQPLNNQEEQEPSSDDTTLNEQEPPQAAPAESIDLTGTWSSEANEGAWMEATISVDSISVDWVSDEGSTRSIYWVGTYTAPTEPAENYTWVSNRNAEQTDNALLASTDDTKEFTYSSGKISYSVSMMGTTTQIELSRAQ